MADGGARENSADQSDQCVCEPHGARLGVASMHNMKFQQQQFRFPAKLNIHSIC
jgi:hypothetical protein